jgi:DNA-binding LytR/AlgR family response regulator
MKPEQPNYANDDEFFAKEPPLQLTLRVMQGIYSNSKFWIGAVAVIAILTIAGPFDTLNDLEFAPRLVYWAAISLVTWPMGMGCSIYFGVGLYQRGIPEWIARIIGGLIGGIPIGFFVWAINKYIAGNDIGTLEDLVRLIGYTTIISAAVSILYYLIESSVRPEGQSTSLANGSIASHVQTTTSPFFARLPVELGKDLISLQAQDHYIKVMTSKGSEMILMRLSDAEKELETVPGIRTHRSWWVSHKHIQETERENEKTSIILSNGEKVPVSRTYAKAVREYLENRTA